MTPPIALLATTRVAGLPAPAAYAAAGVILILAIVITAAIVRRAGRVALTQRLTALGSRLGLNPPAEEGSIENALSYLEQVTGAAAEAVAEASSDAIRLRRSLDALPQGVVLCDETGKVVYRNTPANALGPVELADFAIALGHRFGAETSLIEGDALVYHRDCLLLSR